MELSQESDMVIEKSWLQPERVAGGTEKKAQDSVTQNKAGLMLYRNTVTQLAANNHQVCYSVGFKFRHTLGEY